MKKLYSILAFSFCALFGTSVLAQPCSGTPGTPTLSAISQTVCAGQTASVSTNFYTGTGLVCQWQSSTVSPVGPFTSISGANYWGYQTPTLSPGVIWYNVIITCTNSSQSSQAVIGITVSACTNTCSGTPAPTAINPGSQTICASNYASLKLSTTYTDSGISYQWYSSSSSSGPFTAISGAVQSGYASGALNTNTYYEAIVTCANGGGTTSATSTVVVAQCTSCAGTPGSNTVTPANQIVCPGGSAAMGLVNSYTASGITYQWMSSTVSAVGPFTSIPGATNTSYTSGPLNNTTYYNVLITCTNSSGSIQVPHTVTVGNCCPVNSNFTLTPTNTLQVWNAIPASSTSIAAAEWQWGDGSTSNTLFTSHQYSAAGMYSICLSVTLTCGSSSMSCASYSVYRNASGVIQVNVIPGETVGMIERAKTADLLRVYPNPSNGLLTLELNGTSAPATIEITSLTGQQVYRSVENNPGKLMKEINLSNLENGFYFISVRQGQTTSTTKISIQK